MQTRARAPQHRPIHSGADHSDRHAQQERRDPESPPALWIMNGSGRSESSRCAHLAESIAAVARRAGFSVALTHLAPHVLPLMDSHQRESGLPVAVMELETLLAGCSAVVLVTPTYHNSYSGRLKNCLDFFGSREFGGKVVGLVCHSGGIRSTEPIAHLRAVMRAVGARVVNAQVCTCDQDFVDGQVSTEIENRLHELITSIADEVAMLAHWTSTSGSV